MRNGPSSDYGPIPLVLGTTGHRNLSSDRVSLERAVRQTLIEYRTKYPATRIVVLSPLAEGADRLVAREALGAGCALVVPLPMSQAEYERDFLDPGSLAEFRALLAHAEASFVVPLPPGYQTNDVPNREFLYANCGAYIVRHCVDLIALWDGEDSPTGGTGEIVHFQLNGIPSPYVPRDLASDPSFTGPVIHVCAPREASDLASQEPGAVTKLYPRTTKDAGTAFASAKSQIERFNNESRPLAGLSVADRAERLANGYQKRTNRSLLAIFLLAFPALMVYNAKGVFSHNLIAVLIAYLVFTALAFVPYGLQRRGDWQTRYQDYRALETILRIADFWRAADVDRSVVAQFSKSVTARVDWVAIAVRTLTEPLGPAAAESQRPFDERLKDVYAKWIVDQQRYFTETAGKRNRSRERGSRTVTKACAGLSMAFAITTYAAPSIPVLAKATFLNSPIVIFVAALLAVVAALVRSFSEKSGWEAHGKLYGLMGTLYTYAAERLGPVLERDLDDPVMRRRAQEILIMLGDEAIRENTLWLNLHRSQPLKVPHK